MIEGKPSETALHVAAARAAHLRFDPAPHLLEDHPAIHLLGPESSALIDGYDDDGPWVLVENRLFIPLRARYVEDRLRAGYAGGVRQLVILGAGLDSFALRQPEDLEGIEVFEVDFPSMQEWKRERLARLGWSLPENTHFIPCDFEKTSISKVLRESGFDPTRPAVISWLGVVYYLEKQTVAAALADLATILAPGSEVVFDSMRPWEELPERYQELRETMAKFLKGAGEPHVNRYPREEITGVIERAGFSEAIVEERATIEERYIEPLETRIPLSERFRLVVARK